MGKFVEFAALPRLPGADVADVRMGNPNWRKLTGSRFTVLHTLSLLAIAAEFTPENDSDLK